MKFIKLESSAEQVATAVDVFESLSIPGKEDQM